MIEMKGSRGDRIEGDDDGADEGDDCCRSNMPNAFSQ